MKLVSALPYVPTVTRRLKEAVMTATQTADLTPEQKKEQRAAKERERRAIVKVIDAAKLEMTVGQLTDEQKDRAANLERDKKTGLGGKALATWVLEGAALPTTAETDAVIAAKAKAEKTRQNVTRSADPEASELAHAAKAMAPDVKSSFLPKEARSFLADIKGDKPVEALLVRTVEVPAEKEGEAATMKEVKVTFAALERFGIKGEKDPEVRAHVAALGHGTRLWGRKLALMILAQRKREQAAAK